VDVSSETSVPHALHKAFLTPAITYTVHLAV